MAQLSPETEAIIDRLKREGELIRGRSPNSIRQVKLELGKFESIFDTISTNIAEQVDILRSTMSINQESMERARTERDLQEVEPQKSDEVRMLEEQLSLKQLLNQIAEEDKKERERKEKEPSLFSKMSLKTLFVGGAIASVAMPFILGALDEYTGGKVTEFGNLSLEKAQDTFYQISEMGVALSQIEWSKVTEAFSFLASDEFISALKVIGGLAVAVPAVVGLVEGLTGLGLAAGAGKLLGGLGDWLSRGGTVEEGVDPADERRGRRSLGKALSRLRGFTVPALVASAIISGLPAIKDFARKQLLGMSDAELENRKFDVVDAAGNVVAGVSLGAMFGPPGMLIGAIGGLVVSAGQKFVEWFDDEVRDRGVVSNRVERALEEMSDATSKAEEEYRKKLALRAELQKRYTEEQLIQMGLGNEELDRQRKSIEQANAAMRAKAAEAVLETIEDLDAQIAKLESLEGPERNTNMYRTGGGRMPVESEEQYLRKVEKFERNRNLRLERLRRQREGSIMEALGAGVDPTAISAGLVDRYGNQQEIAMQQTMSNDQLKVFVREAVDNIVRAQKAEEAAYAVQPFIYSPINNVAPNINNVSGGTTVDSSRINLSAAGAGFGGQTDPFGGPAH